MLFSKLRFLIAIMLINPFCMVLSNAVPIRNHTFTSTHLPGSVSSSSWTSGRGHHPKVWGVTKYASLAGPTLAIFLYNHLSDSYEKYRPLVSSKLQQFWEQVKDTSDLPFRGKNSISLRRSRDGESSLAVAVANDVIKIMNTRLRERAVISRIQMDDDPFEFTRNLTPNELHSVAGEVLDKVMKAGSGKFLDEHNKYIVRKLVMRAVL